MADTTHDVQDRKASSSEIENGDIEKGNASRESDPVTGPTTPTTDETTQTNRETDQDNKQVIAPNPLDFDGPDDPDNPHNWPLRKKVYQMLIPGFYGFAVTFGTSVYSPAVFDVMNHFHVSRTAAIVPLTVYTLGLSLGPIFSAPLSEKHGRRIVYMLASPIFMLFTLGAGFSKNFASLVICRFFAGVAGSPALAIGAGTSADLFTPQNRAIVTSMFLAAPFAGPSLGPVIGGFVAQYKSWRWTQWCILFITVTVFLFSLPAQETYKPIILKRRAKKRGIAPPPKTKDSGVAEAKKTLMMNIVRPIHMLFVEPVVFFLSLYTAFAFAILFLLFAAIPYIFESPSYNFTVSQTGLVFLAVGLGVLLASLTAIIVDRTLYQKQFRHAVGKGKQNARPEHRLYSAMIGCFGIPIGLFWFAWTADRGVHWIVPTLAAVPFAWGNLCLFTSAALYMVDVYGPKNGASAIAANGILRYTLGGTFPLFTIQMYEKLGIGWATSLLGFLSVLMLPIPFVLYRWGPGIRKRSRYPVAM